MLTSSPWVAEADLVVLRRRRPPHGGLVGGVIVTVSLELGADAVDAAAIRELEVLEAAPPVAGEGPLATRPQVAVRGCPPARVCSPF